MKKKLLTNKITPCCVLPFEQMWFWISNITLNSESDREYIISKLNQNSTLSIDAWKMLINSGTLESDSSLTKAEFLEWFDCKRQPSCEQLVILIESFKIGNYNPENEYGVGWTEIANFETYNDKIIRKVVNYVGGVGTMPTELSENIGKYYAASGGFTTNKDLATDFKPSGISGVTDFFDPENDTEPIGAKQTYDFLIQNEIQSQQTVETWSNFSNNFASQNGGVINLGGYQCLINVPALNVSKVILNLKTHISSIGLITVYGKKIDGTYETIYDSVNQTLVDFEVNVTPNTYKYIYFNAQSGAASVGIVRESSTKKIFAPADVEQEVDKINSALNYFIQDETTEIVSKNGIGGYTENGNVHPLGGFDMVNNVDATGVYKVELTADTRPADYGLVTMYGQKLDNSYETIFDIPNQHLVSYPINISPNTYKKFYFNVKDSSPVAPVKVFKKTSNQDAVLNYINSHSGGGGGISIPNTFVFAETAGVSATNTGAQNLSIINNLIETNKTKGATIILPVGVLQIAGTIELWSTVSLVGSLRGRVGTTVGGTILKATTSDIMINVKRNVDATNDTAQTFGNMQLDGANVATKAIYVGEGLAFFTFENMDIKRFTQVCIHTVGALIYTMRNLRVGVAPTGLLVQRTPAFQCNHIRFDMCQFYGITGVACVLSGGGQVVFEQCDWEQNGTTGNTNSGNMTIDGFSPSGEGIDVTLNNCWSEYINGGFWMRINNSAGVTTIRDTMFWRLSGTAPKGIINNGAKVLLTGSTKISDFTTDIETTANGQTRADGFTTISTHSESTGGTYKTANFT